jgi:hypothetical protein
MATQTRNPTSDTSVTGTWSGSASSRYTLVDDYPDQGTDTLTLTGFSGGRIVFGFSAFTVPSGSLIQSVSLDYYDQTTVSAKNRVAGSLRLSSTNYDGTLHGLLTVPSPRTDTWTVSPATGNPWTVSEVNAIGGFGLVSTYANPDASVHSIRIRVEYTEPPPTRGIFLERLLRNTVWDKLTLYDFEAESAGALTDIEERTGQYASKTQTFPEDPPVTFTNYRDLIGQTGEKAEVVPLALNGRNALKFKSSTATRYIKKSEDSSTPSVDYRVGDAVVVCRYNGATFANDAVLISDNVANSTLKGDSTEDEFLSNATTYELNWSVPVTKLAPMNEWGAVRISRSPGFDFGNLSDRLTLGDQYDGTGDNWLGDVAEIMFFSSPLTSTERKQVKFYNQLKWGLLGMSTVNFPDPTITGIDYARYYEVPADYSEVTYTNDYEDGGRSFNQSGTPPKRWEIEFTGLDPDEAEIFDIFHDLVKMVGTFDFTDPASVTYSDVRVESYERNHTGHRSWINTVRFTLTQYPV